MKQFGSNATPYPSEMRTQLWPLCCGARILSGLKSTAAMSQQEVSKQIKEIIEDYVPDHQVFAGETMKPHLTFLTLNSGQTADPKIMAAVEENGFKLFATGKPRGSVQSFFVRDTSNSFELKAA